MKKLKRFKYKGTKYRLAPMFNLRLIDFGNAVFPEDFSMATINTRQFRAPEVILSKTFPPLRLKYFVLEQRLIL